MSNVKTSMYSSRVADKFVLRLPEGMRDQISEIANKNHHSMNSEMIIRLERTLEEDKGSTVAPWNPVIGMAVTLREGEYAGKPLYITAFKVNDRELMVHLTGVDGVGLNSLSDLKPYLVK